MKYRPSLRLLFLAAIIVCLPVIAHAQTQPVSAPPAPHGTTLERAQSLFGLFAFMIIAFVIGRLRGARRIPWRVICWGTILEFIFGALVIFQPRVLEAVQLAIQKLLDFSN